MLSRIWKFIQACGNPKYFYELIGWWIPWLTGICALLFGVGLYYAFFNSPPDYQQGETVRIMYVHVPAAILSMSVYAFMAINAAIGLIWRIKVSEVLASASAPPGACFTFLALVTGSLWGKPMWGTYWVWDARLTSELFLLFLYFGFIGLQLAIEDKRLANKAAGILAIIGVINLPIIKYSVVWWNTLHQGPTISKIGKPSITMDLAIPLFIMIAAYYFYFFTNLFIRTRQEILEREKHTTWVQAVLEDSK